MFFVSLALVSAALTLFLTLFRSYLLLHHQIFHLFTKISANSCLATFTIRTITVFAIRPLFVASRSYSRQACLISNSIRKVQVPLKWFVERFFAWGLCLSFVLHFDKVPQSKDYHTNDTVFRIWCFNRGIHKTTIGLNSFKVTFWQDWYL